MSRAYEKIRDGLLEALAVAQGLQIATNYLASPVSRAPDLPKPRTGGLQEPVSHTKGRDMTRKLQLIPKPAPDRASGDQETIERIARYIEQPPENSRVFTITPPVAERLLADYNQHNRPRKPRSISVYASDMASGAWRLTGDTIKFSDAALLRDGQNRLMACVRCNKPFATHVVFGIEDDAFAVLDQGKKRGGSDVLSIAGYANTAHLAAAVRWAYLLEEGRVKQRDSLMPQEALALLQSRYDGLADYISLASAIYRVTGQPTGMVAALLYTFAHRNHAKASQFADAWASGETAGAFSCLGKLQRAIATLAAASSGRVHDVVRAALIVIAWNLYVEGRRGTATDFIWAPSEVFPEIKR